MLGAIPFGGLNIVGGSGTVALATTAIQFALWSAAGGSNSDADSYDTVGDPAVVPDYLNNRLKLNCPGIYLIIATISGTNAAGATTVLQVRKNLVVVPKLKIQSYIGTNQGQVVLCGILQVLPTDNPKNLTTFPNPVDASGYQIQPSGGYGGAGGAPSTLCQVDLMIGCTTSTDTLTVTQASLTAARVG